MGFLDKVTTQAKDLKGKVDGKVEDLQGRRRAADLLEQLGRQAYAQRTGRALPAGEAEIERIVGELQRLEGEGINVLADR